MLTGGLPPLIDSPCAADDTYRHLFPRVIAQNHKYYKRFPGDIARVQRIVTHLSKQPDGGLRLANGDHLTPRCLLLPRLTSVLVMLLHVLEVDHVTMLVYYMARSDRNEYLTLL